MTSTTDMRKQKILRQKQEFLDTMTDDFDELTYHIKVRKLKEYLQKRRIDENKKNSMNEKKNPSTAYRPTNISLPRPSNLSGKRDDDGENEDGQMDDLFA